MRINFIFLLFLCFFAGYSGCGNIESGPPLLILYDGDDLGRYTAEILKAEGLNDFELSPLSEWQVNRPVSDRYSTVILSGKVSDPALWKVLDNYVNNGGSLISVIPQEYPFQLTGIRKLPEGQIPDYIYIDTTLKEGICLTGHRIQVHAERRCYSADPSIVRAWFGTRSGPSGEFPAVVIKGHGKGQTVAFLYNLPANIVLTRQGNPGFAGMEKDGIPGLRAMDLFTDGWVDTACNTINQADEQMHLLTSLIERMNNDRLPLPRLWYFPDTLKCLVTLTNDGEYRSENDFERQFSDIDSAGARMSLYVMETQKVSRTWTEKWTGRGFEISGHPDDTKEASSPSWVRMDSVVGAKVKEISGLYGLKMKTNVNHWFVWCGNDSSNKQEFAAQALIEVNYGIGLDLNYAHYDNNSVSGHFLGTPGEEQGNFTGSGLPMRFSTSDGRTINIWQHLNNVYDQQYNENHDPGGFFECFKGLMDRSTKNDIYSFISIKSHNDEYYFSKLPLMRMLKYAGERNIPVWTASRLIHFIKARDSAEFRKLKFSDNKLSFTFMTNPEIRDNLTIMIPSEFAGRYIKEITANNTRVPFFIKPVRGKRYAVIITESGRNYDFVVSYNKTGKRQI